MMPDQWEGLLTLFEKSYEMLPMPKPGQRANWRQPAETCLGTLNKIKKVIKYNNDSNVTVFVETFSSDDSYGRTVKRERPMKGSSELICQAGIASSLLAYANEKPSCTNALIELASQLSQSLKLFYDPETDFFQNTYPPREEEWERRVLDTWYSFHNIYHVMRVCYYNHDEELLTLAIRSLKRLIRFVRACQYHIPLFSKIGLKGKNREHLDDGEVIGYAINPSVLGMYAKCLTFAAKLKPDKKSNYYKEARHALTILHRFPYNQLFHQTVQLSWAASAAHDLGETKLRDDFTRCLLLSCYRVGPHAGLFQGCAGLSYPSFRETVEAIEFWPEWMMESPKELQLKTILELVLEKATNFLVENKDLECLPNEGLSTLEQPAADRVGIASYAAPQVFELARIQQIFNL